jgi:hypothetical protein
VVAIATGSKHSMAIIGDSTPVLQAKVSAAWTDDTFIMRFATQSRRTYQAEFTDSLQNSNWTAPRRSTECPSTAMVDGATRLC